MKPASLILLGLLALAGCRHPKDAPPDYDSVRRNSEDAHRDLDNAK